MLVTYNEASRFAMNFSGVGVRTTLFTCKTKNRKLRYFTGIINLKLS